MKKWKIFVTTFKKLFDEHYTCDSSFDMDNFTFVKVNDAYPLELNGNRLEYDILFERDFRIFNADLQKKGYHENSVLYHIYKNNVHKEYDYIGFIEYDHVIGDHFTADVQRRIDSAEHDLLFAFNKFSFRQLWEQGVLMNPRRRLKETGDPHSPWNCVNVILNDYNRFFGTAYRVEDLVAKNCFPICHCFMMPSRGFDKIMNFHSSVMESGKVERYHQHNWRARAGLMERYLAVALALEDAEIVDRFQLEHRSYPIKIIQPDWAKSSLYHRLSHYIQKHF
jgi:hypothetical protein